MGNNQIRQDRPHHGARTRRRKTKIAAARKAERREDVELNTLAARIVVDNGGGQ